MDIATLRREARLLIARDILMHPEDADLPAEDLRRIATEVVLRRQRDDGTPQPRLAAAGSSLRAEP